VRLIYFVLFLSLVACKENVDTHDSSLKENSGDHIDKVDSEQMAVLSQANSQSNMPLESSTAVSNAIENVQAQEVPQSSSQSNISVVSSSSDASGETDIEQTQEFSRTKSPINLPEASTSPTDIQQIVKLSPIEPQINSPIASLSEELILNDVSSNTSIEENQQINHPPSATDDLVLILEDQVALLNGLLINDQDLDGDKIKITGFSQAESGVVKFVNDFVMEYTPSPDFNGVDEFSYTISDGNGGESTAQVILNVQNVNDTPHAKADSYVVSQHQANTINVIANDEGLGDAAKLSILVFPENGNLELLNNNKLVFTPKSDYFGLDSFVYQLIDTDGEMSTATVRLNVECLSNCTRVFSLSWEPSISLGVAAYRVYVGKFAHQLNTIFDIGHITNFDYTASQKGEYYFAISAFNSEGIESELSEVMKGVF